MCPSLRERIFDPQTFNLQFRDSLHACDAGRIDGNDLDDAGLANSMNRELTLVLWFIGSVGAVLWTVLWTCFGIFSFIYKRPTRPVVVILFIAFGIRLSREGFKTFREEKDSRERER